MENYRFEVIHLGNSRYAIRDNNDGKFVADKRGFIRKWGIKSNAESIAIRLERGWEGYATSKLGVAS